MLNREMFHKKRRKKKQERGSKRGEGGDRPGPFCTTKGPLSLGQSQTGWVGPTGKALAPAWPGANRLHIDSLWQSRAESRARD